MDSASLELKRQHENHITLGLVVQDPVAWISWHSYFSLQSNTQIMRIKEIITKDYCGLQSPKIVVTLLCYLHR